LKLQLLRDYKDGHTPGILIVGGKHFYTIERPWLPSPNHKGGMNKISCVPEGIYDIRPYSSEKFPNVWSLENPDLDVFIELEEGKVGRSHILIHSGNSVIDVIGCIAVGMAHQNKQYVMRSRMAIAALRELLKEDEHQLTIGVRRREFTGLDEARKTSSDGISSVENQEKRHEG
jgi:hypothetical protein